MKPANSSVSIYFIDSLIIDKISHYSIRTNDLRLAHRYHAAKPWLTQKLYVSIPMKRIKIVKEKQIDGVIHCMWHDMIKIN